MMKFTEFNLDEKVLKGIEKAGFEICTEVQEETFKHTLAGKDVFAQSQTGTGKTAAFLITIFQSFIERPDFEDKKALIIVPTRELAVQIEKEAKLLASHLDYLIGSFYGGVGYAKQEKLLTSGVKIMIGTPGRLIDLNQSKKLNFKDIGILVIDEADRLFDMGFFPDLRRMLKKMPPVSERRTLLFSATLNVRVKNLAWEYMESPAEVLITPDQVTVDKIQQRLYHVACREKMGLLLGLLEKEKPANGIIFTNTKKSAFEVAKRLEKNGIQCEYIIGDLPQSKRLKIIESVKSGKISFLVATDVAARGLHIDDLEIVVNYDLPQETENYVHRIGRTARLGKSGKAISMACEKFVYSLEGIEEYIGMKIPVDWADEELFVKDVSAGMSFRLESDGRDRSSGKRDGARKTASKKTSARKPSSKKASPKKKAAAKKVVKKTSSSAGTRSGARADSAGKPAPMVSAGQKTASKKRTSSVKRAENKTVKKSVKKVAKKVGKKTAIESRLEYYNEKYGDSFTIKSQTKGIGEKKDKKTEGKVKKIFRRILKKK